MEKDEKTEKVVTEVTAGLRLVGAEALRFLRVVEIGMKRNSYANKSKIMRELLGLSPLKALTEEDVIYFRTGKRPKK